MLSTLNIAPITPLKNRKSKNRRYEPGKKSSPYTFAALLEELATSGAVQARRDGFDESRRDRPPHPEEAPTVRILRPLAEGEDPENVPVMFSRRV